MARRRGGCEAYEKDEVHAPAPQGFAARAAPFGRPAWLIALRLIKGYAGSLAPQQLIVPRDRQEDVAAQVSHAGYTCGSPSRLRNS